jgi:hypothetical protein
VGADPATITEIVEVTSWLSPFLKISGSGKTPDGKTAGSRKSSRIDGSSNGSGASPQFVNRLTSCPAHGWRSRLLLVVRYLPLVVLDFTFNCLRSSWLPPKAKCAQFGYLANRSPRLP